MLAQRYLSQMVLAIAVLYQALHHEEMSGDLLFLLGMASGLMASVAFHLAIDFWEERL